MIYLILFSLHTAGGFNNSLDSYIVLDDAKSQPIYIVEEYYDKLKHNHYLKYVRKELLKSRDLIPIGRNYKLNDSGRFCLTFTTDLFPTYVNYWKIECLEYYLLSLIDLRIYVTTIMMDSRVMHHQFVGFSS